MTYDAAARLHQAQERFECRGKCETECKTLGYCPHDRALIAEHLRAYGDQREREALERAAKAIYNAEAGGDCEYNKGGGPDGGCSLRGDCLCGHWNEALDKAKAKVLALIPKGPTND